MATTSGLAVAMCSRRTRERLPSADILLWPIWQDRTALVQPRGPVANQQNFFRLVSHAHSWRGVCFPCAGC